MKNYSILQTSLVKQHSSILKNPFKSLLNTLPEFFWAFFFKEKHKHIIQYNTSTVYTTNWSIINYMREQYSCFFLKPSIL